MQKYAIVLAAGKGTRMKSDLPKVVHPILGKPMVRCVYDNLKKSGIDEIIPVIGYKSESVLKVLPEGCKYAIQSEQLGTGHAVMQVKDLLKGKKGLTIVLAGDQPLITDTSIKNLINYHTENGMGITMLTTETDDPAGYGRIIRKNGEVDKIVEHKDCTEEELLVTEVNISTFCFDNEKLFELIEKIGNNNSQGEYYLTDLVEIFKKENLKVGAVKALTFEETIGINDKYALSVAENYKKLEVNKKHMINGVTIMDPNNTYIAEDVEIGSGTIIYPNSMIMGDTIIGQDCEIKSSYIFDSHIGNNTVVGPYAHLRNHAVVGDNARIGNFVEVKKSTIGNNTKAAHLTYIGDCEAGENINFGCGVITVNYDGKNKFKTVIEDNAFIGSNVNLIAPITIGKGAIVAAGSTVSKNVGEDDLAIARARQTNKTGYAKNIRKK